MVFATWERTVRADAENSDVAFIFDDNIGFRFHIVGGSGVMTEGMTTEAPATYRSSGPDFLRLIVGELGVADALRSGRMAMEGDETQLERLFSGRTFNR